MGYMDVVEFAARMSPARDFVDVAVAVEMMKSRVGIGLQRTLEVLQMPPRMFSLAIFRIGEPHGGWGLKTCRTIVADIGPEPAGFGFTVAGSEHRNRRIVGVDLGCREHMLADLFDQRSEQFAGSAHPASQG